jgi:phage/plasmid-associated DNA primase
LLADTLTSLYFFAADAGGLLYIYRDGVYVSDADQQIRREVKRLLADWGWSARWSTHLVKEVAAYIGSDTLQLWERPPTTVVNLANGLLELQTRTLRPHDPSFFSPIQLPVHYDPTI